MSNVDIIGIIIGVLGTIFGIWWTNKTKDKTQLSLINVNFLSLLSTFKDKFETLKIEFYQLPIDTNLVYYKASILNTGTIDIDKSKIYNPLQVIFPADCQIKECKITGKANENISVTQQIQNNLLTFEWDLLKPKESFTYECIIECGQTYGRYQFLYEVTTKHRIADVNKIEKIDLLDVSKRSKASMFFDKILPFLTLLVFLGLSLKGVFDSVKSFTHPEVTVSRQVVSATTKKPIDLHPYNSDSIIIKSGNQKSIISISDLSTHIALKPVIRIQKDRYSLLILWSVCSLALGLVIIAALKSEGRQLRKFRILNTLKS